MQIVHMIVIVFAVVRRPQVWGEACRALPSLARHGWWRRAPFLPLPDPAYLRWRIATAYGSPAARVDADDVVAFLIWRKRQRIG